MSWRLHVREVESDALNTQPLTGRYDEDSAGVAHRSGSTTKPVAPGPLHCGQELACSFDVGRGGHASMIPSIFLQHGSARPSFATGAESLRLATRLHFYDDLDKAVSIEVEVKLIQQYRFAR